MTTILLFVVGYVTDNTARILCEVDSTTDIRLDIDHKFIKQQTLYTDTPTTILLEDLQPRKKYHIRISTSVDQRIGSFVTSPSKLNFLSCSNQKKGDQKAWKYMLRQMPDMIVHLGDQVYMDYGNNTFENATKQDTYEQMLQIFKQEYRRQWNLPYMKEILSTCSNVMLYDDHDIVDSFDQLISLPQDWNEKGWYKLQQQYLDNRSKAIIAAIQCMCEYQLSLCGLDKPQSWIIDVAGKKIGFVETRISRASNTRLQFPQCDILVTGVPIFMMPDKICNRYTNGIGRLFQIYDIYDQWNMHRQNMEDAISQLPCVQLLIAGDSHAGAKSTISFKNKNIKQYITSGIDTPTSPKILKYLLYLYRRYIRKSIRGNVHVKHEYWIWYNNYLQVDMNNLEDINHIVPSLII